MVAYRVVLACSFSSVASAFLIAPRMMAEMPISEKSTFAELRNFVKEKGLEVKTSGPGRNKAAVWADVKAQMGGAVVPTAAAVKSPPPPAPAPPPPAPPPPAPTASAPSATPLEEVAAPPPLDLGDEDVPAAEPSADGERTDIVSDEERRLDALRQSVLAAAAAGQEAAADAEAADAAKAADAEAAAKAREAAAAAAKRAEQPQVMSTHFDWALGSNRQKF